MHLNDGQRFLAGTDTVQLNGYGLIADDARRRQHRMAFGNFNGGIPCPKGWLIPKAVTDACESLKHEGTAIARGIEDKISPVTDTAKAAVTYFAPSRPSGGVASPETSPDQPSGGPDQPSGGPDQPSNTPDGQRGAGAPVQAASWLSRNWKYVLGGALVVGAGLAVARRKK